VVFSVRLQDGKYVCALCGARLEIEVARPMVVIHSASGKPNMRVLEVAGREIHRCEIKPARPV
jgi:hypothetical protein